MKALTLSSMCVLLMYCFSDAKNTFNSFSLGLGLPMSNSSVPTMKNENEELVNNKKLNLGWDAGWSFFGKPFTNSESALSGLAFGGKISYSRWVRDSTWTPTTFLGVQGIVRYYTPPLIKPLDLFAQVGGGLFIGEYGFGDPDTLQDNTTPSEVIVTEGMKKMGVHFGIGVDWDVIELFPVITIVFTKPKASIWLSLNAAVTF